MRALLQRVTTAQVTVDGEVMGRIGRGLLVFVGVGRGDDEDCAARLWAKIRGLRIFSDDEGRMNLDVGQVAGSVLMVSQFTLHGDCRRGRRPSFAASAPAEEARRLYDHLCELAAADVPCERGVFGAHMMVDLENDGPVTIWLDTDEL